MNQSTIIEELKQLGLFPCVLFSSYSNDSESVFEKVRERVGSWYNGSPFDLDGGNIFTSSTTLFLTQAQKEELSRLIENTPVKLYTITSLKAAFDAGFESGVLASEEDTRDEDWHRLMCQAGAACARFASKNEFETKELQTQGYAVWTGLTVLLNMAASMSQMFNRTITRKLAQEAEQNGTVDWPSVHRRASELNRGIVYSVFCFEELADVIRPLAQTLLDYDSPEVKQIVYHLSDKIYGYMGLVSGTIRADVDSTLEMLDNWESFLQSRIALLSRYFSEKGYNRGNDQSPWRCSMHSRGDFTALTPYKWDETFFAELNHEHFWGLNFLGVEGAVGDRTFDILKRLSEQALAEAISCQPEYAESLIQRDGTFSYQIEEMPEELQKAWQTHLEEVREKRRKEALELIHGVADSIINGLPWALPNKYALVPYNPSLHLNRTLALLEFALDKRDVSLGTAEAAEHASQELAIQLNMWEHLNVLDEDPELQERLRSLFERSRVALPEGWGDKLVVRNLLPETSSR